MKTTIIAEAGVNHNGSMTFAKLLIDKAAAAGADYVKFQTFKAERLVLKTAEKAEYQIRNSNSKENQFEMLKELEISEENHTYLKEYAENKKIKFLSSAFDIEGLDYLNSLGIPLVKIPSGEITNLPYLKKVAKIGNPVILSTGMANIPEIKEALKVIVSESISLDQVTVLHCNSEYPTPFEDVNLKAMLSIRDEFGVDVGYSDHTLGIEVPIAAVALGAKVIEKHFTLDRKMDGPDHSSSLEPKELKNMVFSIRNIEKAINGTGVKMASSSEEKNKVIVRKSLYSNKALKKNHIISENDFEGLRPGDGISPMSINELIGKKLINGIPIYHKLNLKDIK